MALRYTYQIDDIPPLSGAPLDVQLAAGTLYARSSATLCLQHLDDNRKPTRGSTFTLVQDFAGLGGTLKYIAPTDGRYLYG